MKNVCRVKSLILIVILLLNMLNLNSFKVYAAEVEIAMFPMQCLNISQGENGTYSHKGIKAIDNTGFDSGRDAFYAPFSGKVVRMYSDWGGTAHDVIIESLNPVTWADGTIDYVHMWLCHDDDVSDMYLGKTFNQGDVIYREGTQGNATGNHVHFICGKGKYTGLTKASSGKWTVKNEVSSYKVFFLYENTTVYDDEGYNWKTLSGVKSSFVDNEFVGERVNLTGVTSITETTARINAKLSPGANVSEIGFYLGTSPDNMQKKEENQPAYVESIWYDLGTGKWTGALQPGTTYYYQIYAIVGGVTHKSTIDSFTTAARNYNLYVNPNGGVFSDGSSAVVTANPQLIYGGSNWYNISGFQASRNGYTLDGWYNAATSGTKVYNADGLTCNEGYYWKDNFYVYTGDLSIYAQWTDVAKPVITNVRVGELSSEGYTVYCDVTDNEGIERVSFPTWTDANGQDDLIQDWYNNAKATGVSGNTYSFRVNISDHNNERGSYTTHIYAYDFKGNHEYAGTVVVVPKYVPFPDVKVGSWYYNSVAEVYEKGYMSGRGDGTFGPDIYLTRAEIATVLYNMENKPSVAYSNKFSDVADGQWYSKPISWAYRNDIASGYGNGKFGVGDKITREQMAQMLYAYARMKGYDISYTDGLINQYGDSNKVSNWAKPAMNWAISKGIMSGKGSGSDLSQYKLDPTGNTTRAECAAMLKNFMDAYEK